MRKVVFGRVTLMQGVTCLVGCSPASPHARGPPRLETAGASLPCEPGCADVVTKTESPFFLDFILYLLINTQISLLTFLRIK
jgi:hypothetical protein